MVVRPMAVLGAPVKFLIAVERVRGAYHPLETNELHTFVGQSVEYSFRQGQDAGLEAVRLTRPPRSPFQEIWLTIDAEISGALPGAEGTDARQPTGAHRRPETRDLAPERDRRNPAGRLSVPGDP